MGCEGRGGGGGGEGIGILHGHVIQINQNLPCRANVVVVVQVVGVVGVSGGHVTGPPRRRWCRDGQAAGRQGHRAAKQGVNWPWPPGGQVRRGHTPSRTLPTNFQTLNTTLNKLSNSHQNSQQTFKLSPKLSPKLSTKLSPSFIDRFQVLLIVLGKTINKT